MIDAFDLGRQARWEVEATVRAVEKFREDAKNASPDELPSGRRALIETVGPVAKVIGRWLDAASNVSGGAAGNKKPVWLTRFLAFEPEVLAVVAVSTALKAGPIHEERVGQTMTAFSRRCAAALRDQADHDDWLAGRKGDGPLTEEEMRQHADLVRRFQRANPNPDRRAWGRFAKRIALERSTPWEKIDAARTEIGTALAQALREAAPTELDRHGVLPPWWFEVTPCGPGPLNMRPLCVLLTDYAVEKMLATDSKAELSRPAMLPMLIPPNPWRYDDAE